MNVKNSMVAIVALGFASSALAQSSVTIYGTIDAGIGSIKNSGSGRVTGLLSGGNTTSRLGFRGTEDLGGGLSASFVLEGALNNDVGGGASQTTGLDFARRSTVSLASALGEVRLGRDFLAHYNNLYTYDVSGNRGFEQIEVLSVGKAGVATASGFRASNAISYFLPATLGGFYGQMQYAFSELSSATSPTSNAVGLSTSVANASSDKTGSYAGSRVGYSSGPLNVSASYAQFSDAVRTVGANYYADNYKIGNIGASWDFGFVKTMAFIQTEKIPGRATIQDFQFNTYSVGATAPLGTGLVRFQASRYKQKDSADAANKLSLGYVQFLSKRTQLYADVARIANKGAAAFSLGGGVSGLSIAAPTGGENSTGVAVGMRHSF